MIKYLITGIIIYMSRYINNKIPHYKIEGITMKVLIIEFSYITYKRRYGNLIFRIAYITNNRINIAHLPML